MIFKQIQISGVDDLFDLLRGHRGLKMIYRGQSLATWELEPSIFRSDVVVANCLEDRVQKEKDMLRAFKKRARLSISDHPPYEADWQWLAIARHHELPTRLLDWSESAGVAFYFAVRKRSGEIESVVWCSEKPAVVQTDRDKPFNIKKILLYEPEHIAARIFVQRSVFTVHPSNYKDEEMEWPCNLTKAIITPSAREAIREMLYDLGMDHSLLCPEPSAIASALRELYGPPL